MTPKVIIYRRFSNDEQGEGDRDSLARQLRNCTRYAESEGWTVTDHLVDRGRSAFKGEHLEHSAQLGGFLNGYIEPGTLLIAERLDRLSRRPVGEAMAWLYTLGQRGLQVAIADKRKILTANMGLGDFIEAAVALAVGHEESEKKSERVISARRRRWADAEKKEGKWTNLANRPPLWLKANDERNDWIIDKDRLKTINEIYQWSADGLGAVAITARLNSRGDKPWGAWQRYSDGKWSRTSVRTLLESPAVEGDFVSLTGEHKGKVIHGFFPRIVEADIVAAARDQMRARKRRSGGWKGEVRKPKDKDRTEQAGGKKERSEAAPQRRNLFGGKTRCEVCDQRAYLTSQRKEDRTYTYLRCEGATTKRCTNRQYYPYDRFEQTALDLCIDLALDDRFFEATGELREALIRKAEIKKILDAKIKRRELILQTFEDPQSLKIAASLLTQINDHQRDLEETVRDIERYSGRVNAVEHLRRVTDIRDAAQSDDLAIAEQARAKLRTALSAIVHSVTIGPWNGEKIYTIIFRMGAFGVKITPDGRIRKAVTRVDGKPLWEFMLPEHQAMVASLIRRIEQHGTLERVEGLSDKS